MKKMQTAGAINIPSSVDVRAGSFGQNAVLFLPQQHEKGNVPVRLLGIQERSPRRSHSVRVRCSPLFDGEQMQLHEELAFPASLPVLFERAEGSPDLHSKHERKGDVNFSCLASLRSGAKLLFRTGDGVTGRYFADDSRGRQQELQKIALRSTCEELHGGGETSSLTSETRCHPQRVLHTAART